ncbi:heterokaryon incompatibility protein-domain-containing protein [Podospora aff. communis PSN243]|uniref:Heterokaryon incompatibility protein-domain-containing protein n=1 Tax=Podospora aff. communis PSN243 TaxID=3040156 RepID=A0AAV9H2P4_9PEZI|nr:heterokaryon incompatibility protein-domain-containing protein [Podospora aff. communis PSN243]
MDLPLYTYQPLDLATNTIRILRIFKGHGKDPIHGELIESLLGEDEGLQYEALSYTWGESGNKPFTIELGDKRKHVTENLYEALHQLRRADKDRWLWVDSICIDQENSDEKPHQVSHLRHIYDQADRVLVWLGSSTDDTDLLMDLMVELDTRARKNIKYRKDESTAWLEEWVALSSSNEGGQMQNELNNRRRDALGEIFARAWFRRVWILQEVFCAKRASVICGRKTVPTETFVMMPRLMSINPGIHVQSVLDIMLGCLRRHSWRSQEPDLQTLLRRFRASEATDPRDKIYALLGISSDILANGALRPDYSVPLKQVIQDAIRFSNFPPTGNSTAFADKPRSVHAMRMILDYDGVNVNITDSFGDTPLNIAARTGNSFMANALLKRHEIDVNHIGCEMQTPLEEAELNRHTEVAAQLRQRRDVVARDVSDIAFEGTQSPTHATTPDLPVEVPEPPLRAPKPWEYYPGPQSKHETMLLLNRGHLFHAPLVTEEPLSVLDVGTGEAIWAIDFAEWFPLAEVTVASYCRPVTEQQQVPRNCKLEVLSVPWAQIYMEHDNKFDFIHVQDFRGDIDDLKRLYTKAYRCLKPGGWIEHANLSFKIGYDDGAAPRDCIYATWNRLLQSWVENGPRDHALMDREQYINQIRAAGFREMPHVNECKVPLGPWGPSRQWRRIGLLNQASWEASAGLAMYYSDYYDSSRINHKELRRLFATVRKSLGDPTYYPHRT